MLKHLVTFLGTEIRSISDDNQCNFILTAGFFAVSNAFLTHWEKRVLSKNSVFVYVNECIVMQRNYSNGLRFEKINFRFHFFGKNFVNINLDWCLRHQKYMQQATYQFTVCLLMWSSHPVQSRWQYLRRKITTTKFG